MRLQRMIVAMFMLAFFAVPAWASEKELALEATTSMEQAIRTAVESVPGGKPYEVELSKKKGQIVYKVDIVDANKKAHKVYVDAQTGKLIVEQ